MEGGYQGILDAGAAELIAISGDTVIGLNENIVPLSLSYPVLADSDFSVVDSYNVRDSSNSNQANPTAFIIDADGVIQWKDSGSRYGHRTTSSQIIDALNGL